MNNIRNNFHYINSIISYKLTEKSIDKITNFTIDDLHSPQNQTPTILNTIINNIYSDKNETFQMEDKYGVDENTPISSVEVPIEVEQSNILSSILESESFESGIINPSENYFRKMMIVDKMAAMNGISKLYMDNLTLEGRNVNILVGILHMISHLPYDEVYPQGQMLALCAISHRNNEVAEYGIKCFENWEHKDGAKKLRTVKFSTSWLQDYADDVIRGLSEGE